VLPGGELLQVAGEKNGTGCCYADGGQSHRDNVPVAGVMVMQLLLNRLGLCSAHSVLEASILMYS
jgi:hypothetical protein